MVKTVTLTADTPQKVTFEGAYPYYWIDNKSASDVYASVGVPEADADGTYTVAAGSQLRISGGVGNDGITLLGEGKVQIVASAISACPFKSAQKGGGDDRSISFSKGTILYDGSVNISIGSPGAVVVLMSAANNFDIIAISIGDVTTYLNYNSDTDYLRLRFRRQSPVIFFPKVERYKFDLYSTNVIEETPTEKTPSISKFLSGSFSNDNKEFSISFPSSRGKEAYISNVKILGFNLGVEI